MFDHYLVHGNLNGYEEPELQLGQNGRINILGNDGLSYRRISELAKVRLSIRESIELKEECCSICLETFEENMDVRKMPKCGHVFHQLCIDAWLRRKDECPNCKEST